MSSARILIIEDDPEIARLLRFDLEDSDFTVQHADSGLAGLTQAREQEPDLIVLDLGLPDFDGSMVVSRLRANTTVPIIVLTARDAVDEKVRLLSLGADDYLAKPFQSAELVARIRAQFRQHVGSGVSIRDLTLYADERRASFRDIEVPLTRTEFDLLIALAREPGRVYRREELNEAVWEGALPEDSNVIDVHVGNVRNKLREIGAYGILRTVRGMGYALRV